MSVWIEFKIDLFQPKHERSLGSQEFEFEKNTIGFKNPGNGIFEKRPLLTLE